MLVADNREVEQAMALFQETENIDIDPAAGVAFASLLKQIASGELDRHASVLLNITGGGWQRKHRDHEFVPVHVALEIAEHEQALDETIEKIRELF
jgi:cysteate synthase